MKALALLPWLFLVSTASANPSRQMWVWDEAVVTDSIKKAALISFAESHDIKTVFLESEATLQTNQPALISFIEVAYKHGIAVELLFGNNCWINPNLPKDIKDPCYNTGAARDYAVSLASQAVKMSAAMKIKPSGIHYDVEPVGYAEAYGLPWKSNNAQTNRVAANYLDLLKKIKAVSEGSGLPVSADTMLAFSKTLVKIGSETRPLSRFTMDAVDRTVLMDYFTDARKIIAGAKPFLEYAKSVKKPMVIGVAIDDYKGCAACTYFIFGKNADQRMDADLSAVRSFFATNPSFAGFAVESYIDYWRF